MITCAFNGRLGNNMFQIANVISISKKLKTDFFLGKTTYAGHRNTRLVDLSIFGYKFDIKSDILLPNKYQETELDNGNIPIQDNTIYSGFYSNWKYFDDVREDLINVYFTPNDNIQKRLNIYNVKPNSLGISVRRGDFLMLQDQHPVLSKKYYQDCIDTYFSEIELDDIYIFSDDIDWCKENFGSDVKYVEDEIGVQLFLMTKMNHLILSNSTFAWWGAYLNTNLGYKIIPDPWLGPAYSHIDTSGIYYPGWIKMKHELVKHEYTITQNMID